MAINKVEIENFTVFENTDINFSDKINVIIGENGTGKTHLFKLIASTIFGLNNIRIAENISGAPTKFSIIEELNAYDTPIEFFGTNFKSLIRKKGTDSYCRLKYKENILIFKMVNTESGFWLNFYSEDGYSQDDKEYMELNFELNNIVKNMIFVPAKDMLTHSRGLLEMAKKHSKDMPFDKTLLDIIGKSRLWKLDDIPTIAKPIIPKLENIIGGKIVVENDTFFVQRVDGEKIEFSIEDLLKKIKW